MAFMKPEVYEGQYYEVSANHGETHIVPFDVVGNMNQYAALADYVEGEIDNPDDNTELCRGWLCRLSAPGYLDCTEWSAFETEQEARDYLADMYGDDEDEDDDHCCGDECRSNGCHRE